LENRRLGANTAEKLDEIKEELLKQAREGDGMDYIRVDENLRNLAAESGKVEKRQKILRSLLFPSFKARYESIKSAHPSTFDWIFEDTSSTLREWLRTGVGIYWVRGKAGSGKSTLLRYLSGHPKTSAALRSWAGTYQLVVGRHFFWNAGSSMQKSQAGLLQTLLYQVLKKCPDLVESVCPAQWSDQNSGDLESWSGEDLFAAFEELSKITLASTRFCFFVDGLDEYHGDYQDLILLLNKLAKSPSIKFCVSSRPWNVFVDAFQSYPYLKLEDLTAKDIETYVRRLLEENSKFKRVQSQDPRCNKIVEDVVKRAQGVFLWVYLVVDSLLKGLIDGDDISDMQRRLDHLPSDLEEYFEHIIRTIEQFYREETVRYFETAVNALEPLPVLAFKFLGEEKHKDKDYALKAPIRSYSSDEFEDIHSTMKIRLNARCKDLLELIEDTSETTLMYRYRVDFLHRTVRDFFLKTGAVEKLRDGLPYFDAKLSLCRIMVALTKTLPIEKNVKPVLNHMFSLSDEFMYHARSIEIDSNHEVRERRLTNVVKLLDELDRVNIQHTKMMGGHWSNLRDVPKGVSTAALFMEYNQKTFLASAIQAKLVFYVKEKLGHDPKLIHRKRGRPLLDYALRPNMMTPIELRDHEARPDFEMVRLLLDYGANPNQQIFIYDNKRVWHLFLRLCNENRHFHSFQSSEDESKEMYSVVELLVQNDADFNSEFEDEEGRAFTGASALRAFLTEKDIETLERLVTEKKRHSGFSLRRLFGFE
jgi:hypothetical protein